MTKLALNKSRLGVLEIVYLLAATTVLIWGGLSIWQDQDSKAVENNAQQEVVMKTYSDDFVTFTYPSNWEVKRDDNESLPGTKMLELRSPLRQHPLENLGDTESRFVLNIFADGGDYETGECEDCEVIGEVVSLNNPYIPNMKLIFTEASGVLSENDGAADIVAVTNEDSVSVGQQGYGKVRINNAKLSIYSSFHSPEGGTYSQDNFTSIEAFKATESYKELVEILKSLSVK